MDGLGVVWYTDASASYVKGVSGLRPALYKSQSPPINDFNFRSLCENTETHCVFAHIRASSGSVVTQVNSHPFVFGQHTFMHNGVISNFSTIRRDMTNLMSFDTYCNIFGSTDSEHAAALYMTNLTNHGSKETWQKSYPLDAMLNAMTKTITQIMELQKKNQGNKRTPNSLNFCVSDGSQLIATRFRNHDIQQPPSLYWSEFAGRSLNQKYPGHPDSADLVNEYATKGDDEKIGKHTIVASEPTTYDKNQWHLIGPNCALTVDIKGVETEVPIQYDESLNAEDPAHEIVGTR
jgi:glutamine amidotransferase